MSLEKLLEVPFAQGDFYRDVCPRGKGETQYLLPFPARQQGRHGDGDGLNPAQMCSHLAAEAKQLRCLRAGCSYHFWGEEAERARLV